ELLSLRRQSREQEGLRVLPFAADLERTEVFVPLSVRGLGLGLSPQLQLVEVFGRDLSLAQPLEQMVPQRGRQPNPLDLRHHSPKVMRASSSLRRLCSSGSRACVKRSARSRKCFLSSSRASSPDSISSTRIRLALVRLDFASDLTRRAMPGGRLTLWRTGLSTVAIAPGYTKMHHGAPRGRRREAESSLVAAAWIPARAPRA